MGLIREPLNIDFIVDSRPLTSDDTKSISDFIKADKLKNAKSKLPKRKSARFKKAIQ